MGDEHAEQGNDSEHRELDHALHELEREKCQQDSDDDGKKRHLRRFAPNLSCASMTMPTQIARMIAMMSPIIAPPLLPQDRQPPTIASDSHSCARPSS